MWLNRIFGRQNREDRSTASTKTLRRRLGARQLQLEPLEQRRLLSVNVEIHPITNLVTITDDGGSFGAADTVQEDNNVTLSSAQINVGPDAGMQPGLLITDPAGVKYEPTASSGIWYVSPTQVFVPQQYDFDGAAPGGPNAPVNVLTATVNVDLQGGDDTLTFDNNFSTDMPGVLTTVNVRGGDNGGNSDTLLLDANTTGTVNIEADSSVPGQTNITGYTGAPGIAINSKGYETIRYTGGGTGYNLDVNLDYGAHTARVFNTVPQTMDAVTSNALPTIEFTAIDSFEIDGGAQPDTVTFATNNLEGADSYFFDASDDEGSTLVIEGSGEQDDYTISLAGGEVQVQDNVSPTTPLITTDSMRANEVLKINTLGNADLVTVSTNGGLINVPIEYNGGDGNDKLTVQGGTGAPTLDYTPGSDTSAGTLDYNTGTMLINFTGLEPIVDNLVVPTLTVNGTNGDNAISYTAGAGASSGLVSVDGFETIEFTNKATLAIDGRAGSDTINLNNSAAVTGLGAITVNGGDPTDGSDTVIVNGTTGGDAIVLTGITADGAVVTGAQLVPVTVTTAEHLAIDGQGGTDSLTYTSPNNADSIAFDPGATPSAGAITAFDIGTGNALLPMSFSQTGSGGNLTFLDGGGRTDTLNIRGTDTADRFNMAANGDVQIRTADNSVDKTKNIVSTGVSALALHGLDGDDSFNIPGSHPFSSLQVFGGNPGSGSDELNYASAGATTVELGVSEIEDAGNGASPDVTYAGIETINVDATNGALTVQGTAGDDVMEATPYGAGAGTVETSGDVPMVNYTNDPANTVTVDPFGGENEVVVNATAAIDNPITVNVPGSSVNTGGNGGTVLFSANNTDTLTVNGLAGDDVFEVTPGAIPVTLDGGDPIAASDVVNLIMPAGAETVTFNPGPLADEGSFSFVGLSTVSFDNIEGASVDVSLSGGVLFVNGTNGDDNITVEGNDATQTTDDLFVSINAGPRILYTGVDDLTVNGLNGDDDIDIAVNDLALTTFAVKGGLPSTNGDTVTATGLATVADNASWTPNMVTDGGVLVVGSQSIGISLTERLIYDGLDDNETLTVNGTSANDRFVHTPGGAGDEGEISITDIGNDDSGLGIEYVDLGLGGQININGGGGANNILVVFGTASNDTLAVAGVAAGTVQLQSNYGNSAAQNHVPIDTNGSIDTLILDGLDGDDTFEVNGGHPYLDIRLEGGDPSASDVANLNGDGITGIVFYTGTSAQTIVGGGLTTTTLVGIEEVNLDADTQDIIVRGTTSPDSYDVTPISATSTEIQVAGVNQLLTTINDRNLTITDVTPGDGDTVTVHGTSGNDGPLPADDIDVVRGAVTNVTVRGFKPVGVTTADMEALVVDAGLGDDAIRVSGTGGPQLTVVGGDQAATDTLFVTNTAGGTTTVTPGTTSDAGTINTPDTANDTAFAGIEDVQLISSAATDDLIILGTNDADTMTLLNDGANRVWVNDRAAVTFTNFDDIDLNARLGDDKVNVTPDALAGVNTIDVIGGGPTASDELVVNGTAGNDDITFTPTQPDEGTVAIVGAPDINFFSTESVVINAGASNDDDILTVEGGGGSDTIVHRHGDTIDSGSVRVNAFVPLTYLNLGVGGTLTIDGGVGGEDTLNLLSNDESDRLDVAFPNPNEINAVLTNSAGQHVAVGSTRVEKYGIDTFGGDDLIVVTAPVQANSLRILGGDNSSSSDVLQLVGEQDDDVTIAPDAFANDEQDVIGLGAQIDVLGIEQIELVTANSLTVNLGDGDNTARVERGSDVSSLSADLVTSDSLPRIQFADVVEFNVNGGVDGSDAVTFVTRNLAGAIDYQANLDGSDTLVIEGADGATDNYTLSEPGAGEVQVDDGISAVQVIGTGMGRVQINTLGGDDEVTVDGTGGLIDALIGYDGGTGSDKLTVMGTVTDATYSPGPAITEGRLTHDTQTIDFVNLEPVVDLTFANLTVNGTDADNAIDYRDLGGNGLVSVDGFETIEFANKTDVTLDGGAGSDAIHVDAVTSGFTGTLFVNGDAPVVSGDTLTVTGAIPTVTVDHANNRVTGVGPNQIDYTTIERLTVNAGAANELAFFGATDYTVNPGAETDQGEVLSSGVPVTFDGFGTGDTIDLLGTGLGTKTINGTAADDSFNVAVGVQNDVTILGRATVEIADASTVTLNGYEGDDLFTVDGGNGLAVLNVFGGDGDDDDLLDANTPAGPVTVDMGLRTVAGYGATINYTGLQTIDADGGSDAVTVNATTGDDTIEVTPLDADAGTLQANGADPVVNYSNTNALGVVVDALGGEDTLVVNATSAIDDVTVDVPGLTIDTGTFGGLVTFTGNTEALTVNGLEGADTFDVTPGSIPVFVDGGDPIGGSDDLNLNIGGGTLTFNPGPESDEGSFVLDALPAVSFDHIEGGTITGTLPNATVNINGTNADNDITIIGTGANSFTVSVDGSPAFAFDDIANLSVDGLAGDDDIDIDVNDLALTSFVVVGGLPSTNGDIVTVSGLSGLVNDNATWTPTGNTADEGQMTLAGQTISIESVERLIYDGENENELLTVVGAGTGDRYTHTPGAARDAGAVTIDNGIATLLGIEYVNLGLAGEVQINGTGDNDTLVARGTDGSDVIVIDDQPGSTQTNITLSSGLGQHVVLQAIFDSIANFEIRSLEGDDDVNVDGPIRFPLSVFGGGPGAGSDTLNLTADDADDNDVVISPLATASDDQWITGLGIAPITSSGVELITLTGIGADDTLDVQLGTGDDTARVSRGNGADVVTSSSLPTIEFSDEFTTLEAFTVTGGLGSDVVTFVTRNLAGAVNTNYAAALDANDTLVIEGSDGAADAYTLTEPAGGQVQVDDANGTTVRVTGTGMGRVQVDTLGGDDEVTVDGTGGLIDALIGYDGGTGSDKLTVMGTVTDATYSPGPAITEGRLNHDTQTIDFVNLEPVIDLTFANLTVNGTDADNAIDYRDLGGNGLVSVDGFETIEFANKTDVTLNGGAGSDAIHVAAVTSGFMGTLFVNGDEPVVSGDTLTVTGAATPVTVDHAAGTVTGAGPALIDYGTIEGLTVNAGASTELAFTGATDYTINPGAETDQGEVLSSGVPVTFDGFGAGSTIDLLGSGVVMATINGTSANDAFDVAVGVQNDVTITGRTTVEIADGSTVTLNAYAGDDLFTVDGQNGLSVLNVFGGDGDGRRSVGCPIRPLERSRLTWDCVRLPVTGRPSTTRGCKPSTLTAVWTRLRSMQRPATTRSR